MDYMKKEDFKTGIDLLLEMIQPERQADATELLTNLSDGFNTVADANEILIKEKGTASKEIERLRKVNTDLFLKVGAENKSDNIKPPAEETNDEEIPSFDSLFNEKGELI